MTKATTAADRKVQELGIFHDVAKAVYEEQSFENRMLKSYIKSWPDEEGQ